MSETLELIINMEIDVDGAPNAYGPRGKSTLDYELNAHIGGTSRGAVVGYIMVLDPDNPNRRVPATQGPDDPFPGYYVSTTAFQDSKNTNPRDPRRYVDSSKIHYVVRGREAEHHGVHLGDFVAVHSLKHDRSVFGIVGDSGNSTGAEGSLALLQALGYPFTTGKTGSVDRREIVVRYFPGSNADHHFFKDQAQIDGEATALGLSKDFSEHH